MGRVSWLCQREGVGQTVKSGAVPGEQLQLHNKTGDKFRFQATLGNDQFTHCSLRGSDLAYISTEEFVRNVKKRKTFIKHSQVEICFSDVT